MKKLFLMFCMVLFSHSLFAQQEHIFEVKRLSNWGKDYLTVVDSKFFLDLDADDNIRGEYCGYKTVEGLGLWNGMVILKINGRSTKGMSEKQFYEILDNCAERVELVAQNFGHGYEKPGKVVIEKCGNVVPDFANKAYIQKAFELSYNKKYASDYHNSYGYEYNKLVSNRNSSLKSNGTNCSELLDPDFDWFNVRTYDFHIVGDDPLTDRAILEQLKIPGYWKRDTKKPDVIFTIAKDSKQSISSTYVPPTVRTVNDGSKTEAKYNALTGKTEYTTRYNTRTVRDGGYTKTTSSTDMFLELSLLDAKRMNDPKQTSAPIVWQATFKRHVVNANFNVVDEYKAWATWVNMFSIDYLNSFKLEAYTFERLWACSEDNVVTYAAPNSRLKVGDVVLKYKPTQKGKWSTKFGLNVIDSEAGEKSVYSKWWGNKQYIKTNKFNDVVYAVRVKRANGKTETIKYVPFLQKTGSVRRFIWREYEPL